MLQNRNSVLAFGSLKVIQVHISDFEYIFDKSAVINDIP